MKETNIKIKIILLQLESLTDFELDEIINNANEVEFKKILILLAEIKGILIKE